MSVDPQSSQSSGEWEIAGAWGWEEAGPYFGPYFGEAEGEVMEELEVLEVREAWWRNPAYALAGLAWANWFGLCWVMALELVAGSAFVIGLWVAFLFLAIAGSAMGSAKRKEEE